MRPLSTLRIAIQTSGQPKLGKSVAKYLKDQGFENIHRIGWPDRQRQTEIMCSEGNLEAAADLKKILA